MAGIDGDGGDQNASGHAQTSLRLLNELYLAGWLHLTMAQTYRHGSNNNNNNNNNCLPGTSRFLQHRVSLRFQSPPPPCGGNLLFLMYFAVPQSQPSRPLTLRHITFVEPGLPLLLPDARKYFLASSDSQALGCLTGSLEC